MFDVIEAVNGVMGQLQQLADMTGGLYGTEEEWELIINRVRAIPAYLINAETNLQAGIQKGNLPDWRKIQRDGINGSSAAASFFENDLTGYAGSESTTDG